MTTTLQTDSATTRRFCWQVPEVYRDQLLSAEGLRLSEWLRDGSARIVKHGPHRTVYRVAIPGLDFYLKHYRLFDARSWLRQCFRPAKARIEYDRALAVQAREVPTAAPLGIGESSFRAGPGESFLLTHTLPYTEPLSRFLEAILPALSRQCQSQVRQSLCIALARLLARMHDAGITHHDLHAGNILVRLAGDALPELFLIDLHSVSLGPPLNWTRTRANLIALNGWFIMRAERSERLRFWREYHRLRSPRLTFSRSEDELARELEEATWESNLSFWERRDGRCLKSNRYYRPVRSGCFVGHSVRELDLESISAILRDPDSVFQLPGAVLLKNSPSSTVAELEIAVGAATWRVIFKRFRVTQFFDPLLSVIRRTSAERSWTHGQGLRERGLPTARTLLVLQRRRFGMCHEGYLLTEKVPDALDLRTFADRMAALPEVERRSLLRGHLEQIARLVGELHRRGLSQRDLKAANILMSPERCPWTLLPPAQPPLPHEPWLIDLVGISRHRRLSRRRRIQNLSRLLASFWQHRLLTRADKLRFLRTYLQWGLFGRGEWKAWWQAVDAATRAKVEKNLRSGRPLA